MSLLISSQLLKDIHTHGESTYPEEGVGLLLGMVDGDQKKVTRILILANTQEESARHNRYMLSPLDYLHAEQEADSLGLDVLGVFHSHPDHPNRPSDFDRERAMPWFSYLITSVQSGQAVGSRSWLLEEDRSHFNEEQIQKISEK